MCSTWNTCARAAATISQTSSAVPITQGRRSGRCAARGGCGAPVAFEGQSTLELARSPGVVSHGAMGLPAGFDPTPALLGRGRERESLGGLVEDLRSGGGWALVVRG